MLTGMVFSLEKCSRKHSGFCFFVCLVCFFKEKEFFPWRTYLVISYESWQVGEVIKTLNFLFKGVKRIDSSPWEKTGIERPE